MTALLALAGNTVRELTRNKLLYLIAVFSVLLILGSIFLMEISLGQWDRIVKDVSLGVIQLSGAAVAILIGVNLIASEIDRRTVYITLAKPVSRAQFILGKYLGLCAIMLFLVAVMGGLLCLLLLIIKVPPTLSTFGALLLIYVELCILAAFSMAFSSFTTQTLGVMFAGSVFVIGHMTEDLRVFALRLHGAEAWLIQGLSYALPNLDALNIKTQAANNLPIEPKFLLTSAAYGLCYAPLALIVATVIFSRRDFK
jgi:ABC-type transport system involved in multi-copper enzyme maturation permease subunit